MRKQGNWELFGVKPNEDAAKIAQEQYNLTVKVGLEEEAEYPDRFFDVVTLWDVLEYLHDPKIHLREFTVSVNLMGSLYSECPTAIA